MKTHPDRDHIRRVIDSQERRARNTTRALITTMVMERLPEIGDLLDTTGKFLGKTGNEEDEEAGEGVGAGVVDLLL